MTMKNLQDKHYALLGNIKKNLPGLEKLAEKCDSHWGTEDLVYRYYHESFKVYEVQNLTKAICNALKRNSPHKTQKIRDPYFLRIIEGSMNNRTWKLEDNQRWDKVCRPFLEAYFHSKYFLDMSVKYGNEYGKKRVIPVRVGSGWAALLELYGIR